MSTDGGSTQPCVVEWRANVADHRSVSCLRVRLALSLAGGRGCTSTPTCDIEVFADNEEGCELVYCHSLVHLRRPIEASLLWLGRTASRPVHESVRGNRDVSAGGCWSPRQGNKASPAVLQPVMRTVAEAIMGVTLAIVHLLGAEQVELQAVDEGSGRLIKFYQEHGFVVQQKRNDRERDPRRKTWTRMEGPTTVLAQLAPEAWLVGLVPDDFRPAEWLQEGTARLWQDRVHAGRLPCWEWAVSSPSPGMLSTTMTKCRDRNEACEGVVIDIRLVGTKGRDVARGQAVVFPEEELLWVTQLACGQHDGWLLVYSLPLEKEGPGRIPSEVRAAPAVAVLGLLATIAQWFGVTAVRLEPFEPGSGRMMHYFLNIGFSNSSADKPPEVDGHISGVLEAAPCLEAPCPQLALRCCPAEWSEDLMRAEDKNRFEQALSVKQFPHGSLARRHGNVCWAERRGTQQEGSLTRQRKQLIPVVLTVVASGISTSWGLPTPSPCDQTLLHRHLHECHLTRWPTAALTT